MPVIVDVLVECAWGASEEPGGGGVDGLGLTPSQTGVKNRLDQCLRPGQPLAADVTQVGQGRCWLVGDRPSELFAEDRGHLGEVDRAWTGQDVAGAAVGDGIGQDCGFVRLVAGFLQRSVAVLLPRSHRTGCR